MPIGDGFGQLIRENGVTQAASGVKIVSDPLVDSLGNVADYAAAKTKKALMDKSIEQGAIDGASGQIQAVKPYNDYNVAYQRAAEQAFVSKSILDMRDAIEQAAIQNQYNPDGFMDSVTKAKQEAIKGTSPNYAVRLEAEWNKNTQRQLFGIQHAKQENDFKINSDNLKAEEAVLTGLLESKARSNTLTDAESIEALNRLDAIAQEKRANPLFRYGDKEYLRDSQNRSSRLTAITIGGVVAKQFQTNIEGGMTLTEAKLASETEFQKQFDSNENLKNLGQLDRKRIYDAANDSLELEMTKAADARKIKVEEERAAAKELKAKQKENYDVNWDLADTGGLTIGQINAMENKGDIDGAQSRSLISALRAGQSRRQREERTAQAAERTANAAERSAANRERNSNNSSLTYDLLDLASVNPDEAISKARVYRSNGVLKESSFRSIISAARSENNADDSFRKKDIRGLLRELKVDADESNYILTAYDKYIDTNPNASAKDRDAWVNTFKNRYVQEVTKRQRVVRPTPQSRNLPLSEKRRIVDEGEVSLNAARAKANANTYKPKSEID